MMMALTSGAGLAGLAVIALLTALASWMVTRWVIRFLHRRQVLDHPNERSSHTAPTPRGGGIGLLAVALPLIGAIAWLHMPDGGIGRSLPAVVGLAAVLALISWIDDLRGLPARLRFAAHVIAAGAALALMPADLFVFQNLLPPWLDRLAAALLWVWFVNLYNFMDGIDGLAGVETVAIGLGLFACLAAIGPQTGEAGIAIALSALVTAAAATGFLALNWHPARVFMGDVGAIALGYLLGWLLLILAAWGYWTAALILPGYYLADATITLIRRATAGEPVWRAHKKHFYQRAVQRGLSHARVARFIACGNGALVVLAVASTQVVTAGGDALCLGGAAIVIGFMLFWLARAPAPGIPGRPPMDLPR